MITPDLVVRTADYSSRGGTDVDCLILHTAEGSTTAKGLGLYFRDSTRQVSSHWGIGQQGELGLYVHPDLAAWTAGAVNLRAEQVELCGFARWSRTTWLGFPKMLETCARLIADRAQARKLAIRHGSVTDLKNHVRAVYDHDDASKAYSGTHWDVGAGFPWDVVLGRATQLSKESTVTDAQRIARLEQQLGHTREVVERLRRIVKDNVDLDAQQTAEIDALKPAPEENGTQP